MDQNDNQSAGGQGNDLVERRRAFGRLLQAAREEQGMSVQALAQATRISIAFIEAMEQGALERLPGEVFGRGFVRSIAKTTGQDPDGMIQGFNALWVKGATKSVLKVEIKNKPVIQRGEAFKETLHHTLSLLRRGLGMKLAIVAIAAVALIYGLIQAQPWAMLRRSSTASVNAPLAAPAVAEDAATDEPEAPDVLAAQTAMPEPVAAESMPEAAPRPTTAVTAPVAVPSEAANPVALAAVESGGEQMLELVVTEPVRIKMDLDSGTAAAKEYKPDTYRIPFKDKADLMIYNAAAVKITFNGRPVGSLGNKGRIRRISFQAKAPMEKKL